MKYLLVVAHADPKGESTTYQLCNHSKKALEAAGHEVRVVDLIKDGFLECPSEKDFINIGEGRFDYAALQRPENLSPVIVKQQKNLEWAENVIVFAPIWFYTLPACFTSYVQRVFTEGWGYTIGAKPERQVLAGRSIMFVILTGAGLEVYSHGGRYQSLEALMYPWTYCFWFMGFKVKYTFPMYSAAYLPKEVLDARIPKLVDAVLNVNARKPLPFKPKYDGMDGIEVFAKIQDIDA